MMIDRRKKGPPQNQPPPIDQAYASASLASASSAQRSASSVSASATSRGEQTRRAMNFDTRATSTIACFSLPSRIFKNELRVYAQHAKCMREAETECVCITR